MTKFNSQLPLLCGRGIEPEFVGPLCYHSPIITQLTGSSNVERILKCPSRLRSQEATSKASEERKPYAIQFSRDGADHLRGTRIYGETQVIGPRARSKAAFRTLAGGSSPIPALLQSRLAINPMVPPSS
jgi:hypothetical protein